MATLTCSDVTAQHCSYHATENHEDVVEADLLNHIESAHSSWYGQLTERERSGVQRRMRLAASQSVGLFE